MHSFMYISSKRYFRKSAEMVSIGNGRDIGRRDSNSTHIELGTKIDFGNVIINF